MIRETAVEKYLKREVEKCGGHAFKLIGVGFRGWPDRFVLLPRRIWKDRTFYLVETKTPVGRLSEHQKRIHKLLADYGIFVRVLSSIQHVDKFMESHYGG